MLKMSTVKSDESWPKFRLGLDGGRCDDLTMTVVTGRLWLCMWRRMWRVQRPFSPRFISPPLCYKQVPGYGVRMRP